MLSSEVITDGRGQANKLLEVNRSQLQTWTAQCLTCVDLQFQPSIVRLNFSKVHPSLMAQLRFRNRVPFVRYLIIHKTLCLRHHEGFCYRHWAGQFIGFQHTSTKLFEHRVDGNWRRIYTKYPKCFALVPASTYMFLARKCELVDQSLCTTPVDFLFSIVDSFILKKTAANGTINPKAYTRNLLGYH